MKGIVALDLNGDEKRIIWTELPNGSYRNPAISPDGQTLAYAMCPATFSCDVFVVAIDDELDTLGEPRRLTPTSAIATGLTWAPDGQSVIYGRQAEYSSYLWRARLDGSPPTRIDLAGDRAQYPSVSMKGGLLAFQASSRNRDIWRLTPSGDREIFISSTRYENTPQFSPDGTRVVFESNRLGRLQIWTANADGSNQRPLMQAGQGGQGSPHWSPDGRWIAYDEQLPEGPQGVFVVSAEGGTGRLLTWGSVPSWSHDGQIYFDRSGGIWRIPVTGGNEEQVVANGTSAIESPDGTTLYYRKLMTPGVLFGVPRSGGVEREVLTQLAPGQLRVVPVQGGIYFVAVSPDRAPSREIRFYDVATRQTRRLFSVEAPDAGGLSVSPDRAALLISGTSANNGDDLNLIRNFR
jgi:Tol biopolymer transport system component